jgi:hypothetical protein
MQVTVYLAGQMGPKPDFAKHLPNPTVHWRNRFKMCMDQNAPSKNYTILDPTEGEAWDDDASAKDAIKSAHDNWKGSLILSKDREMVKQSNVIVANLNHYLPEKIILGTIYELAWAYDDPSKTVIIIANPELAGAPALHPFIRGTAHHFVENEMEAASMVAWLAGSEADKQ